MRIGIDVRYLSHGLMGGVHTYVKHFVPALLAQAPEHQVFLYADNKRPFELTDLPANATLRVLPYRNGLSSLQHDLWTLKQWMSRDKLDVAHFPANYGFAPRGVPAVITLHDEINILPWLGIIWGHPKNARTIGMMTYLHLCSTQAVRRAKLILTVSEYARQRIAQVGRLDADRIVPIHHAPTPDLRRVTDAEALEAVRRKYGLTRPFILADALKNPAVVVRAWERLPEALRQQYHIVFFGRRPDVLPVVPQAVEKGYGHFLLRIPREDLITLYSQAQAFVFPSWIEGFGIPVFEAMVCGAPVIASDRGSLPEVVGGAGLLMDAEADATLAQHLTQILTQPAEAERWRQLGLARVAQYSWANVAQQILTSYHRALAA